MNKNKIFLTLSSIIPLLIISLFFNKADTYAMEPPELWKSKESKAVYLIEDGKRRAYPSDAVYKSWWGSSFSLVYEVPLTTLQKYPLGKNAIFNIGSLIKIQTDSKVYIVKDNLGTIEWIETEEKFKSLGYSFKDIKDVPDSLFPDYTIKTAVPDFATPEQKTEGTATSTATSTLPVVKKDFILSDLTVIKQKESQGVYNATLTFTTSEDSVASLSYVTTGYSTTTIDFATSTTFTKKISTLGGTDYTYKVVTTSGSGENKVLEGKFLSYNDGQVGPISGIVSTTALVQPDLIAGAFSIKNNSTNTLYPTKAYFVFESNETITTQISKNILLYKLNANGSVGTLLGEKIVGVGTSILNMSNIQQMIFNDEIVPGETARYALKLLNFDGINTVNIPITNTFSTRLELIDFLGDTLIVFDKTNMAAFTYTKP